MFVASNRGSHMNALYEYTKSRQIKVIAYDFGENVPIFGDLLVNYTRLEITDIAVSALFINYKRYAKSGVLSTLSNVAITCIVGITK